MFRQDFAGQTMFDQLGSWSNTILDEKLSSCTPLAANPCGYEKFLPRDLKTRTIFFICSLLRTGGHYQSNKDFGEDFLCAISAQKKRTVLCQIHTRNRVTFETEATTTATATTATQNNRFNVNQKPSLCTCVLNFGTFLWSPLPKQQR